MSRSYKNFNKKAFSLIELSIVLVIMAVLVAGSLAVTISSVSNAKAQSTNAKIKTIYQAMGAFLLKNYRLPCPANLTLTKTTSTYGAEIGSQGACSGTGVYTAINQSGIAYGMVPTAALGLSADMAEDAYGNKLAYVVSLKFTKAEYPTATDASGFSFSAITGDPLIKVMDQPSGTLTDGIIFAIISNGQNRVGSFSSTSTTQSADTSTDTYEQQNYLSGISGATANFGVASSPYDTSVVLSLTSFGSDVFDDFVFAKTRDAMISDFDAAFLVPCEGFTDAYGYVYGNGFFGNLVYANRACNTPGTTVPAYRCSAGGVFVDETSTNCSVYLP